MDVKAREISTVLLATLLGVISLTSPWTSLALRAEQLDGDPAPGVLHPRFLETNRTTSRKPSPHVSTPQEFAECETEETDEDEHEHEHEHLLVVPFGELLRLLGPNSPRSVAGHPGPPDCLAPTLLFLLYHRLVC